MTTNPYQKYREKHGEPSSGDSQFLKTEDGGTYRIIILSDAYHFFQEYTDPKTGEKRTNERYAWVVYNTEEKKIQILAKGVSVFKQIFDLALDEDWGYPQWAYDVKLSHKGKLLNTEYTVVPGKKLDDQEASKKLLDEAEKVDLKKILKGGMFIGEEAVDDVLTKEQTTQAGNENVGDDEVVIDDIDDNDVDLNDIPF